MTSCRRVVSQSGPTVVENRASLPSGEGARDPDAADEREVAALDGEPGAADARAEHWPVSVTLSPQVTGLGDALTVTPVGARSVRSERSLPRLVPPAFEATSRKW